jgi:methylated-DNA-[protein]-cysteine S-methyltransferase
MQANHHRAPHYDAVVSAPFGAVGISIHDEQVATELLFGKHALKKATHPLVEQVTSQITAYFNNPNHRFDLPLALNGTPYQQRVWQVIRTIPAGQVLTYQALAQQLDSGARAVANACGANHLPLLIPCHRVVAKNGLGGFMRGHEQGPFIKTTLLQHEGVKL